MNEAKLPPLIKKRYELPLWLLILWFLLLALIMFLGLSRGDLGSYAIGHLSGRFVGMTLVSLFFSWVAWRLSRRSDWVKSTVFLIVLLLYSVDLIGDIGHRRRSAQSAQIARLHDQARRIQEAQVEEFNKTGVISSRGEAMDQMIAAMKEAPRGGNDLASKTLSIFADFLQKGRDLEAKHSQASDKIDSTWIFQPKTPRSIEEISALAVTITNFMQANQTFLAHYTNCAVTLAQNLRSGGVPSGEAQSAIRGFQDSFNPQLPFIEKIRQQDHQFGLVLLQILELYKTEQGKWKWDDQQEVVAFSDQSTNDRWTDLVGAVSEIADEQQKTQTELINLRSKNLSRSPR